MNKEILKEQVLSLIFFNGMKKLMIPKELDFIEEIRIRAGRSVILLSKNSEWFLRDDGQVVNNIRNLFVPTKEDLYKMLQVICKNSLYAYQEEISNGFITLEGGHRVGVVGKILFDKGKIKNVVNFSGLNFRISREVIGCANEILKYVIREGQVLSTLIISPPGAGKTTILRDLSRQISNGVPRLKLKGFKVGIVDERYELLGETDGKFEHDLGIRTDVIQGCPKDIGILMLLRTMSPQVVITDEIGDDRDFTAIKKSMNAGIKIITSYHSYSLREENFRKGVRKFIKEGIFDRIIYLSSNFGPGTLEEVYDTRQKKFLYVRSQLFKVLEG
jgi:stage III sporulation protein AA